MEIFEGSHFNRGKKSLNVVSGMGCLERQELLCGSFRAALRLHMEAEDPASHLAMAADRNRLCSLLGNRADDFWFRHYCLRTCRREECEQHLRWVNLRKLPTSLLNSRCDLNLSFLVRFPEWPRCKPAVKQFSPSLFPEHSVRYVFLKDYWIYKKFLMFCPFFFFFLSLGFFFFSKTCH